jgi:DNA-binding LacI/PurR family transcriptional regulator
VGKRPTRDDVAKLAGVSVATVSYVVNDGPRAVAPGTKARVLAAIEELGYQPHAIARSLKTGNTQTVGLLIHSVVSPGSAYIANAVQDRLVGHNYALLLASTHGNPEMERRMLEVMSQQAIDGLITIPATHKNRDLVERFTERGVPVVFIDRYIPGVDADVVMTDNVRAALRATDYLIQEGCRRIVCISFSAEASSALDRVEGYRQALVQHDLPVVEDLILVQPGPRGRKAAAALDEFIHTSGLPDGILCTTQMITIEVMKLFKSRGIRVPDQVRMVGGFFASPWNDLLVSPLPVVNQDMERMAEIAVEFLMQRVAGETFPCQTVLLDADLIIPGDHDGFGRAF